MTALLILLAMAAAAVVGLWGGQVVGRQMTCADFDRRQAELNRRQVELDATVDRYAAEVDRYQELARRPAVPWHHATDLLRELQVEAADQVHGSDQLRAWIRNFLTILEVDVTDERTLYEVIVTLSLVRHLIAQGHCKGLVSDVTDATVAKSCRALAAALAPLVPPEAIA